MTVNIGTPEQDRASTPQEREELLYELLETWHRVGDMRLGQFLVNVVSSYLKEQEEDARAASFRENVLFMLEDRRIVEEARNYVRKYFPLAGEAATSS